MIKWEYDPDDLRELVIDCDRLRPSNLVAKHLQPLTSNIVFEAQRYPPELPNQKYIRTFKLFEGWRRASMGPLKMRIFNPVPYGIYVQGRDTPFRSEPATQAEIHQGRWPVLFKVAEKHLDALIHKLVRDVKNIWSVDQ